MGVIMGNLMRKDRVQQGLSIEQAARRLNLTPRRYRDLEAGNAWPSFETYQGICDMLCWPLSFGGEVRAPGKSANAYNSYVRNHVSPAIGLRGLNPCLDG